MTAEPATGTPMPVGSQRDLFEVPAGVTYLNTANMSPLLRAVREAGERGLARRATPWTIESSDWFDEVERLRVGFATLTGVDSDGVALIPATSYGLAVAAQNLSAAPGEQVVVLAEEYPSSYYTWHRMCERTGADLAVVRREPGQSWTQAALATIADGTRVVSVPQVHWTNGSPLDLSAVADAAQRVGAALVIDASQSLGASPLDVPRLRPDFVVSVGYKWLLGPFGVGYLYVAEHHREGVPLEENWINRDGSDNFAALVDYTDTYRPGARRFDVGERTNFGLVPMALAALEQLLEWGVANVAASLHRVTDEIATRAGDLGLTVPAADQRAPHMLGVETPRELALRLARELAARGVVASVRGGSLRIAPHLHNTAEDVDRLIDALEQAT